MSEGSVVEVCECHSRVGARRGRKNTHGQRLERTLVERLSRTQTHPDPGKGPVPTGRCLDWVGTPPTSGWSADRPTPDLHGEKRRKDGVGAGFPVTTFTYHG